MNTPTTSEKPTTSLPKWFWSVGGVILLWNLLGLMAYIMQMTMSEAAMAELPADQQELYKNIPMWVTICFTLAVAGGVIGSIGLLMRKKWAMPAFVASLIGILGQNGYMFFLSDTASVMGPGAMVLPVMVVVIAIALVPYSMTCIKKGWLV